MSGEQNFSSGSSAGTGDSHAPSDEESAYFRQKYGAPFSRLNGRGLRVGSSLSALQRVALAFAFPGFAGRATMDPACAVEPKVVAELRALGVSQSVIEKEARLRRSLRRRYSGDSHAPLPRWRYVALDPGGSTLPTYTVLAEMNAYALPDRCGYCIAVPHGSDSIAINFRGLPDEPNPLHIFVSNPDMFNFYQDAQGDPRELISPDVVARIDRAQTFTVVIPCDVVQLHRARVFDLRRPECRAWTVDFVRNPPSAKSDDDLIHGAMLALLLDKYGFDRTAIDGWSSLIPILGARTFGGNAFTDLLAVFIRRLGCDTMVFPSARCDYGVIFEAGKLVDHWGWNAVDYSDLPIPQRVAVELETVLEPLGGVNHVAEISTGVRAGSMAHLGNSRDTRIVNEFLYGRYVFNHGSEWRLRYREPVLRVRGYTWYNRSYSLQPGADQIVGCDACGAVFPIDRVKFFAWCPACAYFGDLGYGVPVPQFLVQELRPL